MNSDQSDIDAANRGDSAGFESLYYRYRDWVFQLALRFTHNYDDAGDVLQDTFAYLLKKFPGIDLTCQLKTFLYPVVKHLALNLHRKNKRLTYDDDLLEEAIAPSVKPATAHLENLMQVLANIPGSSREILLMRFVDQLSLEEISIALNIPIGTVKSRQNRALQALRDDPKTRSYFLE